MENKNIIIGPKNPKDPEYYRDLFTFLMDDLKMVKRKFVFILKYTETNESLAYKDIHFRREYINQVANLLSNLNFDEIINIPREKDGCAFRLEVRYVKSAKMIGMQIIEARVGGGGGYFSVSPAVILLNEEAEKAYRVLSKIL
jgi:hypothetical protein